MSLQFFIGRPFLFPNRLSSCEISAGQTGCCDSAKTQSKNKLHAEYHKLCCVYFFFRKCACRLPLPSTTTLSFHFWSICFDYYSRDHANNTNTFMNHQPWTGSSVVDGATGKGWWVCVRALDCRTSEMAGPNFYSPDERRQSFIKKWDTYVFYGFSTAPVALIGACAWRKGVKLVPTTFLPGSVSRFGGGARVRMSNWRQGKNLRKMKEAGWQKIRHHWTRNDVSFSQTVEDPPAILQLLSLHSDVNVLLSFQHSNKLYYTKPSS